jgi:hypothetical protein
MRCWIALGKRLAMPRHFVLEPDLLTAKGQGVARVQRHPLEFPGFPGEFAPSGFSERLTGSVRI